ncbi:hypothetical protein QMA71_22815 [Pseudomonas otitidis]|jgi:hypothetical protein|uniref:hypothetical protein n=1 Tax=Metapseudomonas otitidis TaxID=319939 RepID=UPI0024ACBCE9|nr:hypothetical protein [Pseudomonas otitidis]MDI6528377.1 hypothetical protein [Pseudomonas otitidis]
MTEINANKDQLDSLSKEDQDKITKGLLDSGAIRDVDKIAGDTSVQPLDENTQLQPLWNPLKDFCKAACDVAAAHGVLRTQGSVARSASPPL